MNLQDKYIEIAKKQILSMVDCESTSVFLFGSRADGTYTSDSDIDIGFISSSKIDNLLFYKIRIALEESIIPYHIDLVDFYNADCEFKKIAMENIIIWNKSKNFN
jgi:predicted nucleotidyltransferase